MLKNKCVQIKKKNQNGHKVHVKKSLLDNIYSK